MLFVPPLRPHPRIPIQVQDSDKRPALMNTTRGHQSSSHVGFIKSYSRILIPLFCLNCVRIFIQSELLTQAFTLSVYSRIVIVVCPPAAAPSANPNTGSRLWQTTCTDEQHARTPIELSGRIIKSYSRILIPLFCLNCVRILYNPIC